MPDLKLAKLPDRTPVRLTISVMPDLHRALIDYAALYASAYGTSEAIGDVIPAMLASFLESDRGICEDAGQIVMTADIDCFLRLDAVLKRTGLSRTTLYRKMRAGTFPKQVQLSERCTGWRESAVRLWAESPSDFSAATMDH